MSQQVQVVLAGAGVPVRATIARNWSIDKVKSQLFSLVNRTAVPNLHASDYHLCLDQRRVLSVEYQNFIRSPFVAELLAQVAPSADGSVTIDLLLFSRATALVIAQPAGASAEPSRSEGTTNGGGAPQRSRALSDLSDLSPTHRPSTYSPPTRSAEDLSAAIVHLGSLLENEPHRRSDPLQAGLDISLVSGLELVAYVSQALQTLVGNPRAFVDDTSASNYLIPLPVLQARQQQQLEQQQQQQPQVVVRQDAQIQARAASSVASSTSVSSSVLESSGSATPSSFLNASASASASVSFEFQDGVPTLDKPSKIVSMRGALVRTEIEEDDSSSSYSDSDSDSDEQAADPTDIDFAEFPPLEKKLGEGSFANVYLTTYKGAPVALKLLKWDADMEEEERDWFISDFQREVSTLKRIAHPNILRFIGACNKEPHFCIVTEFVEGGTLKERLRGRNPKPLPWVQRLKFAYDVALAVQYLHSREPKIVHRDIKAENVLLTAEGEVRLADFGLVKMKNGATLRREGSFIVMDKLLEQHREREQGKKQIVRTLTRRRLPRWESYVEFNDMTSMCGTPSFLAPEIYLMEPFNEKVDVFAFGVLLWEILTRESPHPGLGFTQIGEKITQTERLKIPAYCPPRFKNLMEQCWEHRPTRRPPFAEILLSIEVCVLGEHDAEIPN